MIAPMIKLSFFLLLLTIPLLSGEPLFGIPMWAIGSLFMTLIYGIILVLIIEKKWPQLKGDSDE